MRNNSFSSNPSSPTPPNYEGGDGDFSVVRTADSHLEGTVGAAGRNAHHPNAPLDPLNNTGATDFSQDDEYEQGG